MLAWHYIGAMPSSKWMLIQLKDAYLHRTAEKILVITTMMGWMMCFLLMTLVLVLILNPLLDFFFLYIKLMCPYFILLIYTDGERDGLWMACPFRTLVVLYRMFPFIICVILMNYLMEFYFIGFVNAHLPGCFCPWTFRLNIGLNTSPSDSFVSYLNSHLGYSAGEFQALQLIVLAVFGAVD